MATVEAQENPTELNDSEPMAGRALSDAQADELRTRVRALAHDISRDTWRLAEALFALHEGPRHYLRWGFDSWGAWVESVGISKRKAVYLIALHRHFVVEHPLDDIYAARLRGLDWTKSRLLAEFGLTGAEARRWIDLAATMTREELSQRLRQERSEPAEGSVAEQAADSPKAGVPDWEVFRPMRFLLADTPEDDTSQFAIVKAALERAAQLASSDKAGHLIALICNDFLLSNDFRKSDDDELHLRFLAKFEKLMGKRLVIIDVESGKIEYGLAYLQKLAETVVSEADGADSAAVGSAEAVDGTTSATAPPSGQGENAVISITGPTSVAGAVPSE